MIDFFKPDDFFGALDLDSLGRISSGSRQLLSDRANAKLKSHIETLPEVFSFENDSEWQTYKHLGGKTGREYISTHRASLWGVEEIKPKVCEHKEFVNYEFRSDKGIICTCICGAKLSPNHWKEVE